MPNRRTLLRTGAGLAVAAAGGGAVAAAAQPSATARPRSTAVPRPRAGADWTALQHGLHGKLIRPGDADYDTARRLYNTRFDGLRPAAVAYVSGAGDIAECLAFARRAKVPVSIRNGGHSYAGWSSGNGRLVIDVSNLAAISVSGTDATVGAGAKLIDVYNTLGRRGRTIPAGSCPTVGVSGLTLGGGHGVAARAYGLTCDSLTGAALVTADGRTVQADARHNSELFWALRGAGNGNFGVVTELRYRTHPAPACVTAYLTWPWSKAVAAVRAWQEWGPEQPDEIWSSLHLECATGGSSTLSVAAFSLGSYSGLQNAVDRLAARIGSPARSVSLRHHTYLDAMNAYAGCTDRSPAQCHLPGRTPGRNPAGRLDRETYTARSDFYDRSLSVAGANTLVAQVERLRKATGGGAGSVALTALGGAVNRVAPTATAFVHRRSRFLAQYLASGPLESAAWLPGIHHAMRPYASGAAYQNYIDPTLTDWRRAYYGPALDRLTAVKRQYDPQRLFDFPQAI
ncbi:FAD-binding oxidoreductase [Streptantibioticus cattleyicolor]|uniref:Putative berberine bridge protein n=1 Tax=Streptantibioticus cattleyicolor (strain ATCC 35852 / DSM 46488 / JCM 4925 / NBRC 14057 / NRRL 8057) TaxID=1003195 RepID=F8JMN9_STREN|nr:FAD-binding oxidoreductase [Streptantibioticus cattleyicolor]AEW98776.1 putative berberine bridge protein [Streptantibioticus cattleyicolor NRRL 8057 = DSM 46488]CCB72173.1 Lipoprotein [Streptantibioticus cattleyicolor NRRL 8057 = DSM 46488]